MDPPVGKLPAQVRKAYSDYKKDTDYIVDWLVQTASSKGYFGGNKGKGKALEEAEDATQYKVSSAELQKLATFVRNKEAVVTHTFTNTLDRAIRSRVRVSRQLLPYLSADDEESTYRHEHFVQGKYLHLLPVL